MTAARRPPVLLAAAGLLGAAVSVAPLAYLVERATEQGLGAAWDEVFQRRTFDLAVRSLLLTAAVTAVCVVVGVAAAVVVVRTDLPGRRAWHALLTVPLAVPSYLAAFAWVSARPSLAGMHGATLVLAGVSYPFVYLPVVAALRRVDPALEEVARSLGRSRARALAVTLAQVRPAASAGALLVALYVLSDFGAVGTMRYEAFTWVIYGAYRAGFNPSRAAVLASVLVVLAAGLVVAEARARGRAAARVGGGAARAPRPLPLRGPARLAGLAAVALPVGVGVGFPVYSVVRWLARGQGRSASAGDVWSALGSTLGASVLGTLLTVGLALPVGVLAARHRTRPVAVLERVTYVAHALPGIVVALSMVFVGVKLLEPLYLRTPLLVLAYAVLFLPLAVGSVRGAVEASPRLYEDVARSLGRNGLGAWRAVTLPLASPGIAAGAALVLLTAMKELPVTLLLHPTGVETLSMAVWKHTSVSDYASAAPYAAVLMLAAALPSLVLSRADRSAP